MGRDRLASVAVSSPLLTGVHELGGEPAVSVGDRGLSYGELREAAAAVARQFEGAERVAVWAESTLETCVACVAALATGTPLVPVNPKLGRGELEHVLTDSSPDVVLGGPDGIAVDVGARGGELPATAAGDEDTALIIYTSGTTGRPKGAQLPRRAIASNLDGLAEAWEWTGDDVLTHGLPLFHVHGLVLGLFGPLRRGGELRHLGRFEPAAAAAALTEGATMLFGVPTMYHRLGREAESDASIADGLKRARLLVSGSAPLPAPEFTRIEKLCGQQIVERYGLTETLMNTAVRADSKRMPGYVGVPVPGVEVRLVDDDGGDLDVSDDETIGEVTVRGPNLFTGYRNRPDATGEAMRDGWFFTGDLATVEPEGYWRIVGRRSTDLIKTGGYKVGAGEIEVALLEHPAVKEAAVTGEDDPDLGEKIIAWVVADGDAPAEKDLIDHVAGELAPHKRPREVRFLDELPRNAMGKVVKQRLGD
jgi:malonyl-CoA/methylmalonyl-CoA synthetase